MARALGHMRTLSFELHAGGQPGRRSGKKQRVTDATGSHPQVLTLIVLSVSSNETACLCFSFFSTSHFLLSPSDFPRFLRFPLSLLFLRHFSSPLPSLKGPSVFLLFWHAAFTPLTQSGALISPFPPSLCLVLQYPLSSSR